MSPLPYDGHHSLILAVNVRNIAYIEVNVLVNMNSQLAVSPFTLLRVGLHRVGKELQGLSARVDDILEKKQGLGDIVREVQGMFQRVARGEARVNAILVGEDAILGADRESPPLGQRSRKWLERIERDHNRLSSSEAGFAEKMRIGVRRYTDLPSLPGLTYAVHEKMLVVDGARAIVGGRNLEDRYFTNWIDLDLLVEGPVVRDIQEGFLRSWEFFAGNLGEEATPSRIFGDFQVAGDRGARFVQSRPWLGEYQAMEIRVQMCKPNPDPSKPCTAISNEVIVQLGGYASASLGYVTCTLNWEDWQ